jgi:hypothetical protein
MMNQKEAIPRELEDRVKRELEAGEQIQWMGQPVPRWFAILPMTTYLIFIAVEIFSLIIAYTVLHDKDFGLPINPLVIVILSELLPFMVFSGMLIRSYRKDLKTVYVVTDRRAITLEGGWKMSIRSYTPAALQSMRRQVRGDGIGDLVFSQEQITDSEGASQTRNLGFINIRNPQEAERFLKKLAASGGA